MASRKDYEATARVIRAEMDLVPGDTEYSVTAQMVLYDVADSFAKLYAADNPRFNRTRFMRAAGVPNER